MLLVLLKDPLFVCLRFMYCAHLVRLFRFFLTAILLVRHSLFLFFVGAVHVVFVQSVKHVRCVWWRAAETLASHWNARCIRVRFVVCQKRNYGKLWIIVMIICEQHVGCIGKRYKASTLPRMGDRNEQRKTISPSTATMMNKWLGFTVFCSVWNCHFGRFNSSIFLSLCMYESYALSTAHTKHASHIIPFMDFLCIYGFAYGTHINTRLNWKCVVP